MAKAEGIETDLMLRLPGRLPGLYLIETDAKGERRFRYWRDEAPARELFELPDWNRIAEAMMARAHRLFLRHHAVALFQCRPRAACSPSSRWRARRAPRSCSTAISVRSGWKGDLPRTRTVFMEALKRVDIALPTYDDEAVLWGDPSPEATVERLQAFGIGEIVVKNGPNSALVAAGERQEFVAASGGRRADRHHGGGRQLQRRLYRCAARRREPGSGRGRRPQLAGQKIRHRGAIMPRNSAAVH